MEYALKRIAAVLAVCLAFLATAARGDTLRTFAITGAVTQFNTLTGQVTIDTTTGMGLYGYVQYTDIGGPYAPVQMNLLGPIINSGCVFGYCDTYPDNHQMRISSTNLDGSSLSVFLPTPTDLIGYMGGPLCPYLRECQEDLTTEFIYQNFPYPPFTAPNGQYVPGRNGNGVESFHASLTLVSEVQTPEPSSLLLLCTGALGMLGVCRRKQLN
jgi:hypothetical protein